MKTQEKPAAALKISPVLLLLDVVGSALLGLGLVELISPGAIVPAALQFPFHALLMVVLGVALTLPFLFNLFGQIKRHQHQRSANTSPVQRQ